jgi:hypothetical protein
MKTLALLLVLLSPVAFASGGSISGSPTTFTAGTIKGGAGGTYIVSPVEYDAGTCSTTKTIDWTNGPSQKVAVTGNCTFTFSNPVTGGSYLLRSVQDATGSRTYTWPGTVKWPAGSAPSASGANKIDIFPFYWDGTSYYGSSQLNY